MDIIITPSGNARCVYDEDFNLSSLGTLRIKRGSHVEPNEEAQWTADLCPVNGPVLGPFETRSEALQAEVVWLHEHWLNPPVG